jgi:PAS domain S-box-containing protein
MTIWRFSKLPLSTVLTLPFILQILATVGLVGYLSFRNGQKAVNDLALQLQHEVSDRALQHLDSYFTTPRQINKINQTAIDLEFINPDDLDRTGRYFWQQMKLFPGVSYINYASSQRFVGVGRENNTLYLELANSPQQYTVFSLDDKGNPIKPIRSATLSTLQEVRYASVIDAQKPIWTEVYQAGGDRPGDFTISCGIPLFNSAKALVGVVGVDLFLPQINQFLKNLDVSPTGQVFIMQRDGSLLASSSSELPFVTVNGQPKPLKAFDSQEPLLRETAHQIRDRYPNFSQITTAQTFDFRLQDGGFGKFNPRQFVQVVPWKDPWGLDLLLVVAVPESDFMGQINANTRTTIMLCLAALSVAIALGLLTAQWISRPISKLSQASHSIATGEFNQQIDITGTAELETLAQSFNSMAHQLHTSFAALATQNQNLQQAKQELAIAKEQLEAVLDAVPGPISWVDSGGVYIGVNRHFAQNWNLSREAFIGQDVGFLQGSTQLAEFTRQFLDSSRASASQVIELSINGTTRYYLIAAQKYQQGSATVSVGIDITERRQAEEALRIAEENYRSIFENALEGIFQSSPEGKFLNVNPALAKIYGYDAPDEMIERITNIKEQLYVDTTQRSTFQTLLENESQIKDFEYQSYRKDGTIIWVQIDARVVRDRNNQVLYYEGIVQDITERKYREDELKRQLKELKIEIDHQKRTEEVANLTESSYFQEVQRELSDVNLDKFWS